MQLTLFICSRILYQDLQLAIDQKILEGVLQVSKVWEAELNVQKEMYSSAHMSMKNSLRKVIA